MRPVIDWDHVRDMMSHTIEFKNMVDWIARCLRDSRAYPFEKFEELRKIEEDAG